MVSDLMDHIYIDTSNSLRERLELKQTEANIINSAYWVIIPTLEYHHGV